MGSLFDNSDDKDHTNRPPEDGILPTDLIGLPPPQMMIMRLLLGKHEMSYAQICEAVKSFAETDRLNPAELDETLKALVEHRWLIRDEPAVYRVNLRRKGTGAVNAIGPRRAGRQVAQSLWNALDFDSNDNPPTDTPDDTVDQDKKGETGQ